MVRLIDPIDTMNVVASGQNLYNKRQYLDAYQKYVEQTIIYDRQYHIVVCILRDVTEQQEMQEEAQKVHQQTIEIADKVIAKQMRIVQEIASLLGETTAETKVALTKLKNILQQ